jgi:hypothetical protein
MKEQLLSALEYGKRRGYDELRTIRSTTYLFQYAIKKEGSAFETYFLQIDESKFDVFEDYSEEESRTFQTLDLALDYLHGKGAEIQKLRAIRGVLPF